MKTLKDFQKEVAIKYGLGESLVMGHRKTYFDEATFEYTKYHVQEALKSATIKVGFEDRPYPFDHVVDDDSILNAYPLENIK